MKPLVSVVMPAFNSARFLRPAIESILNQTFTDFELLVVYDDSQDKTLEILKSYSDPRLRLIHNRGKKMPGALNTGICDAQGKYIARFDSDDIAKPTRLEKEVAFLETHPEYILVSTNMEIINEVDEIVKPKVCLDQAYTPPLEWLLLWENPIVHPSVLLRTEVLKHHALSYPDTVAEDSALWRELSFYGRFHRLEEVLISYRVHGDNASIKVKSEMIEAVLSQLKGYAARLGFKEYPSFLGCVADYGQYVNGPLPPYKTFYQFVDVTIRACAARWALTQEEQERCSIYANALYLRAARRMGLRPDLLYLLVYPGGVRMIGQRLRRFFKG